MYSKLSFSGLKLALILGLFVMSFTAMAQTPAAFKSPDDNNRPLTYWMFQNGNMTKEGITKDLEAMKNAGVGGTFFFSVGFYQPGPVKFMSDDWWDHVGHAIKESDRLKMKFGVYNSDGWSMSGGPWITPEESMKQIVWADTLITGGKKLQLKLPQPLQNLIYEDINIVAFPALEYDKPLNPEVISSERVNNPGAAIDQDIKTDVSFLKPEGEKLAHMVLDFGKETLLRRLVFDNVSNNPFLDAVAIVEYSNDGKTFNQIAGDFPVGLKAEGPVKQFTLSFPQIKARYIRLSLDFVASSTKPVIMSQEEVKFGEIAFYSSPRINLWEPKSGQSKRIRHDRQQTFMRELNSDSKEELPVGERVDINRQINLTSMVDKNGVLTWNVPAGKWIIQRIGYTSTGRMVSPATKEGRGLECNKMDSNAVKKHFNAYTAKISDLSKKLVGRPIDYMQMESWEAGIQNWTKGLEKEFEKRNGYSIIPYLPVLAGGYVVNSYRESDKFLWDFRRTIAQMIAENYWRTMYECAKAKGITVSGEGSGMQHYLYDPVLYMKYLDLPMGELWPNEGHARVDIKNASSVAHTYGRPLSGGETFTSGDANLWSVQPFDLKQIGDEAFTLGLNHIVLHTYVHQPYDVAPGITLSKFGNHLQRLNPWYTRAQGWFDYLSRCMYMLRQGKPVQDVAYFTGEGIPSYLGMRWEIHPSLPDGFDYDGVNLDILKRMTVKDGKLCLTTGACYSLLVFQDMDLMTPELLTEIKRLVSAGATIVSKKPSGSPSLSEGSSADGEILATGAEIWNNDKISSFGKGKVYNGLGVGEVLKRLNVEPDFTFKAASADQKVNFVHRRSADEDIYFLASYEKSNLNITATFRVMNKIPELWDADKGTVQKLPYKLTAAGVEVPLKFDPLGSFFIVFRNSATAKEITQTDQVIKQTIPLSKAWNVNFTSSTQNFKTVLDKPVDWSLSVDERIKYFSGTAVYRQKFTVKNPENDRLILDLGECNKNMVTVKVNGQLAANLWKPPYRADISSFVKSGENELELIVTNTATNALVGDERFPADLKYGKNSLVESFPDWLKDPSKRASGRKTFVTFKYIDQNSPLDSSGILGPVTINLMK